VNLSTNRSYLAPSKIASRQVVYEGHVEGFTWG
jgi:hypothetical protein